MERFFSSKFDLKDDAEQSLIKKISCNLCVITAQLIFSIEEHNNLKIQMCKYKLIYEPFQAIAIC